MQELHWVPCFTLFFFKLKTKTMKYTLKKIAFIIFCAVIMAALTIFTAEKLESLKITNPEVQELEKQNSELIDLVVKMQNEEI